MKKIKLAKKTLFVSLIVWVLTLGIHIGSMPNGVPLLGTSTGYFWDEFVEGKREFYMLAFMEVPHFQIGIPFFFTYTGGAIPASLDIALTADSKYNGQIFVAEKATLEYEDGTSYEIIRNNRPRSGVLSIIERSEKLYSSARIGVPNIIRKKQDFTIEIEGFIQTEARKIRFLESATVLYSHNTFFLPGWLYIMSRGV